jgi:hypothetical protein
MKHHVSTWSLDHFIWVFEWPWICHVDRTPICNRVRKWRHMNMDLARPEWPNTYPESAYLMPVQIIGTDDGCDAEAAFRLNACILIWGSVKRKFKIRLISEVLPIGRLALIQIQRISSGLCTRWRRVRALRSPDFFRMKLFCCGKSNTLKCHSAWENVVQWRSSTHLSTAELMKMNRITESMKFLILEARAELSVFSLFNSREKMVRPRRQETTQTDTSSICGYPVPVTLRHVT